MSEHETSEPSSAEDVNHGGTWTYYVSGQALSLAELNAINASRDIQVPEPPGYLLDHAETDPSEEPENDTSEESDRPTVFHFAKLPLELQEEILGYLDVTTNTAFLASLCAVEKAFNARYTPILYRDVSLIAPAREFHRRADNELRSELLCTLVSKINDNASHIRTLSLVDELPNCGAKVAANIIGVIFSLFKKDQLRELRVNLGDTSFYNADAHRFASKTASEFLMSQSRLETLEWNMSENSLEGHCQDDPERIQRLDVITAGRRPDLTSLCLYNIWQDEHLDGIKALLKTAVNLRQLKLGLRAWECEIFESNGAFDEKRFADDISPEEYFIRPEDGEIDYTEEFEDGPIDELSVTFHIFRFIDRGCEFKGQLTSLELEKVRFNKHQLTPRIVANSLNLASLEKLALLDCGGLGLFLKRFNPTELSTLSTLRLEYPVDDAEAVYMFLDNLPAGSLKDLALMQWGGGVELPTAVSSWPRIHAPHLRSLVLDARMEDPAVQSPGGYRYAARSEENSRNRSKFTPVPTDASNDVTVLRDLFSQMISLEELGIVCSLEALTAATRTSGHLWENRSSRRDSNRSTSPVQRDLGSEFLHWLHSDTPAPLPHLKTLQLRNVRDPELVPEEFSATGWAFQPIAAEGRLQADVEYLHEIFPQVRNFILGCKRSTDFFDSSARLKDEQSVHDNVAMVRRMARTHDDSDEEGSTSSDLERGIAAGISGALGNIQSRRWAEAMFPSLYMVVKGKTGGPLYDIETIPVPKVGRVLPVIGYSPWEAYMSQVKVGDERVLEKHLLPWSWKELGSRVYDAAWSRTNSSASSIRSS